MAPSSLVPISGAAIAAALVASIAAPTHAAPPPAEPISSPAPADEAAPPGPPPGPLLREATPPPPAAAPPTAAEAPATRPTEPASHPAPAPQPHAGAGEPRYWTPYPRPKPEEFPESEPPEPFDPRERQNIFNQRISREWDPEKLINTDRPDFTDVLPSVGKHVWQTESGTSFRHRVGDGYTLNRSSLPETTIRLGLTERFELRIKWDSFLFSQRTGTAAEGTPAGKSAYGSDFLLGFKWMAVPQAGWLPGHTLVGTLTTRIGTGGPAQTLLQPGLNWVYGWQINKWLVLRGSTGFEFIVIQPPRRPDQDDVPLPTKSSTVFDLHQSVVTYMQLAKRLGMYLEWFSFYDYGADRLHQQNGGIGAYIYLTPNIQLDLRGGGTLAGTFSETFVGAGISFRGKYKYKKRQ